MALLGTTLQDGTDEKTVRTKGGAAQDLEERGEVEVVGRCSVVGSVMLAMTFFAENNDMQRVALFLSAFVVMSSAIFSQAAADEPVKIPANVKKHMKSMVGSWTFEGHQGDRTFEGEETVRVISGGTALLQKGFFALDDGEKEHYVILSGWDGDQETVLVRGFTSHGISWSGEWKTVSDGVWMGTASGEKATFKVQADSMRYEDGGDGTPWVSEFTRKAE